MSKTVKKSVSLLLSVMMIFSLLTVAPFTASAENPASEPPNAYITAGTLYFKPNSNWMADGARFAMYVHNSTDGKSAWANMSSAGSDYYSASVPSGNWTNVTFARMDPNRTENSWGEGVWNRTAELFPEAGTNCYTMAADAWDEVVGDWSAYTQPSTEQPTELPTEQPSEPSTEQPSEPSTEPSTEPPIQPPTEIPSETITVYFIDRLSWGNVNIYYWGGSSEPEWPGVAMTFSENNEYSEPIYKATIPAGTTGIFFNSGNNQTEDITSGIADGTTWYALETTDFDGKYNVGILESDTPPIEPPSEQPSDSITVYFIDSQHWGNVNIYYYSGGPVWPGFAMDYYGSDSGKNVYKAVVPNNIDGIIFNGNGKLSVDVTTGIADGTTWYALETTDSDGKYHVGILESDTPSTEPPTELPIQPPTEPPTEQPSELPSELPSEPSTEQYEAAGYYLVGSMTDWHINRAYRLTWNDAAETEEYFINNVELSKFDTLKIVYSSNGRDPDQWYPEGGDASYVVSGDGTYNIVFRPGYDGGEDWFDNCLYVAYCEPSIEPSIEPPSELPTEQYEAAGYYLVGSMTGWHINEAYRLTRNDDAAETEEYFINNVELSYSDTLKIVHSSDGRDPDQWYPEGWDDYVVPYDGTYNIVFRPGYDGGEDWFYNCLYVAYCEPSIEPSIEPPTEQPTEQPGNITYDLNDDDTDRASFPPSGYLVTVSFNAPYAVTSVSCFYNNGQYDRMSRDGSAYSLTLDSRPSQLRFRVECEYTDDYDESSPEDPYTVHYSFVHANAVEPGSGTVEMYADNTGSVFDLTYSCTAVPGHPEIYNAPDLPLAVANPTRPNYSFAGWTGTGLAAATKDLTIPVGTSGDLTYTASWTPDQHTFRFYTYGGTEIPDITQAYGTQITAPADPTLDGYTFIGWDSQIPATMPNKDMRFYAEWDPIEYSIEYELNGGSLEDAGCTVVLSPDIPDDYYYDYDFISILWNGTLLNSSDSFQISPVPTEDVEVEVQLIAQKPIGDNDDDIITRIQSFTGTVPADGFLNSGTVSLNPSGFEGEPISLTYNVTPGVTNPETYTVESYPITLYAPVKDHYSFAGWTGTGLAAATTDLTIPAGSTGDRSYTANWTIDRHTVSFAAGEGSGSMASETVDYGTEFKLSAPGFTAPAGKTFKEWSVKIGEADPVSKQPDDTIEVTANTTVTAVWELLIYTVKFVNDDGTVLQSSDLAYGAMPVYTGQTPTKAATAQYKYTFKSWNKTIAAVTGAETYKATFTSTVRKYSITWKNSDGTVLRKDKVAYGATPAYTGQTPTKAATAQYSYTFKGWNNTPVTVTGSAIYVATYTETPNNYTITFDTDGGSAIQPITLAYGATVTAPTNPTRAEFIFLRWSPALPATMPAENITVKAVWVPVFGTPTFTLPAAIKTIGESAFEGNPVMRVVYVPDTCTSIGTNDFKDCTGLTQIRLPKNCTIADGAFNGCTSLIAIYGPAGGTTETWANSNGILFIAE